MYQPYKIFLKLISNFEIRDIAANSNQLAYSINTAIQSILILLQVLILAHWGIFLDDCIGDTFIFHKRSPCCLICNAINGFGENRSNKHFSFMLYSVFKRVHREALPRGTICWGITNSPNHMIMTYDNSFRQKLNSRVL